MATQSSRVSLPATNSTCTRSSSAGRAREHGPNACHLDSHVPVATTGPGRGGGEVSPDPGWSDVAEDDLLGHGARHRERDPRVQPWPDSVRMRGAPVSQPAGAVRVQLDVVAVDPLEQGDQHVPALVPCTTRPLVVAFVLAAPRLVLADRIQAARPHEGNETLAVEPRKLVAHVIFAVPRLVGRTLSCDDVSHALDISLGLGLGLLLRVHSLGLECRDGAGFERAKDGRHLGVRHVEHLAPNRSAVPLAIERRRLDRSVLGALATHQHVPCARTERRDLDVTQRHHARPVARPSRPDRRGEGDLYCNLDLVHGNLRAGAPCAASRPGDQPRRTAKRERQSGCHPAASTAAKLGNFFRDARAPPRSPARRGSPLVPPSPAAGRQHGRQRLREGFGGTRSVVDGSSPSATASRLASSRITLLTFTP